MECLYSISAVYYRALEKLAEHDLFNMSRTANIMVAGILLFWGGFFCLAFFTKESCDTCANYTN
jgi:uncharacterized membrane protein YgdD (TMEM256/DUF423 family)